MFTTGSGAAGLEPSPLWLDSLVYTVASYNGRKTVPEYTLCILK
jgi:hypothetical protein